MLSRKVMNRHGRNYRSYYPSKKLGRMVHCESILERDAVQLFEQAKFIKYFEEQPMVVNYYYEEKIREYFPDFLLITNDEVEILIEVKPSEIMEKPDISKKYDAIKSNLNKRGKNFIILNEVTIRSPKAPELLELIFAFNANGGE